MAEHDQDAAGQRPPETGGEAAEQPNQPSNVAGAPNVPAVDPARAAPPPAQPAPRQVADSTSAAATEGASGQAPPAAQAEQQAAPAATPPGTSGAGVPPAGTPNRPAGPAPARPAGTPPARPAGAAPARPAAGARPAAARPTPPAPPAEPEPDPEEIAGLREVMPDLEWKRVYGDVELNVPKGRLVEIAQRLRDQYDYDYLSAVTAVDWPDRIEMVYHLYSFNYLKRRSGIVLRVDLERPALPDYPLCDSLTRLWPGAEFQEREVFDLMGVKFIGHPDLRRILLSDDFPGHPLRKDFVFDYEYVLVNHLRYGVEGQLAPADGDRRSPN